MGRNTVRDKAMENTDGDHIISGGVEQDGGPQGEQSGGRGAGRGVDEASNLVRSNGLEASSGEEVG